MDLPPINFTPVEAILQVSRPRPRVAWFGYGAGLFALIVLTAFLAGRQSPEAQQIVSALSAMAMIGLTAALMIIAWVAVRAYRAEQQRLQAAEELVSLRRWPEAAMLLENILSRPARSPQAWVQALVFHTAVLARYHRFGDVIAVQEFLLDEIPVDEPTARALKLGRAMAMLREDHLFDADRAIAELRRGGGAGGEGLDSAGLALVEIYRDVKTGHPAEAIEIFEPKLPILRRQLGHRVADAWILAAKAYDLLGRPDDAQQAYQNATILCPLMELQRRYPEVASLQNQYRPAPAPSEMV